MYKLRHRYSSLELTGLLIELLGLLVILYGVAIGVTPPGLQAQWLLLVFGGLGIGAVGLLVSAMGVFGW